MPRDSGSPVHPPHDHAAARFSGEHPACMALRRSAMAVSGQMALAGQ
jgi:hypothetical protein